MPLLIRKLKKKEGLFSKLSRKRRAALGSMVAKIVGEDESDREYHFLPSATGLPGQSEGSIPPPRPAASLKEEIEEAGLVGGLTQPHQEDSRQLSEPEAR